MREGHHAGGSTQVYSGQSAAAAGLTLGTTPLAAMPAVTDDQLQVSSNMVQFDPEIEPLVRLVEDTPREALMNKVLGEIQSGRSYRELLAALFLAGIRNVQPRPAVGSSFTVSWWSTPRTKPAWLRRTNNVGYRFCGP